MHYGDKKQLDNNILIVSIYVHYALDLNKIERYIEMSSIHECKFFNPDLLSDIIFDPDKFLNKKFKNIKEGYYKTTIKQTSRTKFKIIDIQDFEGQRETKKNEMYFLH